jgi:sortase A
VLGDTLAYEVDEISVVDPTDVSSLVPQVNGDYVTLVTCTPYGVNTQRLLVRAHRVDSMGDAGEVTAAGQVERAFGWWRELALAAIAVAALVVAVVARRRKRANERRREDEVRSA